MNSPKTSKLASMASALVMAAVLGPGTVQAQNSLSVADFFSAVLTQSCIADWESSPAATHCNGADDTVVSITHVPHDNDRCLVDVDCSMTVPMVNSPQGEDSTVTFSDFTPASWRTGTGIVRTDIRNIDICFFKGSLTNDQWNHWRSKYRIGCGSDEITSETAMTDGLDLRASSGD